MSRLTSAGVAQSAAYLPVPRHHGIARFGVGGAPVEEGLKRSERDNPHIVTIAWSQFGTKTIAARLTV